MVVIAPGSRRLLLVCAAALIKDGKVLLAQRPSGALAGLWEFPGGKLEAGETPENALVRELFEELNIEVDQESLVPVTFASHADTDADFHLLMPLFACTAWRGEPESSEGQKLRWCTADELECMPVTDMPPADIPLVEHVCRLLRAHHAA